MQWVGGDAQGALKDTEPYLVYTGLGIQEEQLYGSFILEKGNAFNVEPENEVIIKQMNGYFLK